MKDFSLDEKYKESKNLKILIVDDETELRRSLKRVLAQQIDGFKFDLHEAEDGEKAISLIQETSFDLILMDVRMPKIDGLKALNIIKKNNPRVFVVIMTAHSNLKDAITAIKSGAYDYLEKPVEPQKLLKIIKRAFEAQEMVSNLAISQPIFDHDIDSELTSKKIKEVFNLVNVLSKVDSPFMIRGEKGTQKELVARTIHQNSPRKNDDFIKVNCESIPKYLIESEIFGHEKRAFNEHVKRKIGSLQLANSGTIFLNEVSELSIELQVKLLRVLKDKSFVPVSGSREVKSNARIIVATEKNIEKLIEEQKFSAELFERLSLVPIFIPPLRERPDDLYKLIEFFVKKISHKKKYQIHGISNDAAKVLISYDWPGNIDELTETIEQALSKETTSRLELKSIPIKIQTEVNKNITNYKLKKDSMDFDAFKMESEKEFIINALKANKGKINKTVASANIPKNTLLRKIKKYGIDVRKFWE